MIDKHAVSLINIAVTIDKLAYAYAEALEFAINIGRKRGKNSSKMKLVVSIPGQNLCPVHIEQVGHQCRIIFKQHRVSGTKLVAEYLLVHTRQTGGKGLQVLPHYLIFQWAGGPFTFCYYGVELVELEYFREIVELAGKGHHGKARQVFIFKHVIVKRG